MADVLEDPYPEDQEFLNCVDSGNVSDEDESDYEARLYSLVHYSGEPVLAGDKISEPVVYESKRSKVSRLDGVRSIIDSADNPTPLDANESIQAHSKSQRRTNGPREPEEFKKLLESYKRATSKFSHSTPVRERRFEKTFPRNTVKKGSQPFILGVNIIRDSTDTSFLESEVQSWSECFNITSPDVAASRDSVLSDSLNSKKQITSVSNSNSFTNSDSLKNNAENRTELFVETSDRTKANKIKKGKKSTSCVSFIADNNEIPSKYNLQDKKIASSTSLKEVQNEDCSKYDLELRKDKVNTSVPLLNKNSDHKSSKHEKHSIGEKGNDEEEVIVVLDDSSDSDSSILEVEPPIKEFPPVVTLTSDDNEEEGKKKERKISEEEDSDIVVVYSCENTMSKRASGSNERNAGESVKKKIKKKNKKQKKSRSSGMFISNDISPSCWTEDMSHFYNDSWGGENFDINELQLSMSGKRSNWSVLYSDIVPNHRNNEKRNFKCNNCNTFGHVARLCPEPPKPDVCLFCGMTGHLRTKCPTPTCLRCGKAALMYNYGCPKCSSRSSSNEYCSECNLTGHLPSECPEIWRKYHSATTEEEMASRPRTIYKPRDQQFCSNCAARGHLYHECMQSSKQGNWLKRANSSSGNSFREAKRRKLNDKWSNKHNMKKDVRHKKKSKSFSFLDMFRPLYQKNY